MASRLSRTFVGAVAGALPGAILFLVAQFLIEGEWQLTIGAPGMFIGVGGAIAGAVIGFLYPGWKRTGD